MGNNNYDNKKKYAELAFFYCEQILGVCKRKKRKPILKISNRIRFINRSKVFGSYCFYRNIIYLYINNCDTLLDVVKTIIHEYTHYLQPFTKYWNYVKKYYYTANPFEKEAFLNERKYGRKIYNKIRNQLLTSNSGTSRRNKKSVFS
jgi:Zn-dependent peptidase ImmA (M78 family)